MSRTPTGPVLSEPAKVWRCPITRRRYFTRRAAYVSLAKRTILDRCNCEPDVNFTCTMHRTLFHVTAWACNVCSTPDETNGSSCFTCDRGGRHTVATTTTSSGRYQKTKARLARWLMWRDSQSARVVDLAKERTHEQAVAMNRAMDEAKLALRAGAR